MGIETLFSMVRKGHNVSGIHKLVVDDFVMTILIWFLILFSVFVRICMLNILLLCL